MIRKCYSLYELYACIMFTLFVSSSSHYAVTSPSSPPVVFSSSAIPRAPVWNMEITLEYSPILGTSGAEPAERSISEDGAYGCSFTSYIGRCSCISLNPCSGKVYFTHATEYILHHKCAAVYHKSLVHCISYFTHEAA